MLFIEKEKREKKRQHGQVTKTKGKKDRKHVHHQKTPFFLDSELTSDQL